MPRTDFEIPYRELTTKELIGQGAFGRVFNGKWRGTPVAIKMLVCQHLTPDVVKEFRAEVAVLRCVRGVVACLCCWLRTPVPHVASRTCPSSQRSPPPECHPIYGSVHSVATPVHCHRAGTARFIVGGLAWKGKQVRGGRAPATPSLLAAWAACSHQHASFVQAGVAHGVEDDRGHRARHGVPALCEAVNPPPGLKGVLLVHRHAHRQRIGHDRLLPGCWSCRRVGTCLWTTRFPSRCGMAWHGRTRLLPSALTRFLLFPMCHHLWHAPVVRLWPCTRESVHGHHDWQLWHVPVVSRSSSCNHHGLRLAHATTCCRMAPEVLANARYTEKADGEW